jgi:DNA-binding beta-propeller fold protein YncE
MVMAPNGDLYIALREGNTIYKIARKDQTLHRVAGTGEAGYNGDGGPALNAKFGGVATTPAAARAAGPKALALGPDGALYVGDTESNTIRRIDPSTGIISTVLGTGERGDGPETNPLACKLSRPHGLLFVKRDLYVADSEADRIRILHLK